jgi:tetratricopeptide (TPR) repeat protein
MNGAHCLSRVVLVAGAALWLGACGATSLADRETTVPTGPAAGPAAASQPASFEGQVARGDGHFAQRDDRAELERAIAAYGEAAKLQPRSHETWTKLARVTYLLADGFLQFEKDSGDEAMKRYLETHEQGIVYAKRALLAYSAEFQKRMEAGGKLEDAITVLDKGAVPALYWMAGNYGKWGAAKGFTTILKYKDMIKKVMELVLRLDPDFFFAAADRYLGAMYAKSPAIAGGDLDKSMAHFEKSLARYPGYFGTKVLMAEYWATKKEDQAKFEQWLREVIAGDPNGLPAAAPENRIEQRKAKVLLSRVKDLF